MPIPYSLNPLGISVREELPLTLTATVDNSTVTLTATGSPTVSGLHYRLGTFGIWLPYTIGQAIPLDAGESVQFWNSAEELSSSGIDHCTFELTGKINASGYIESLLNWSRSCRVGCLTYLFQNCTALYEPPLFSATTLATRCYRSLFSGDTNLLYSPELPAINLAPQCYEEMFNGCIKLTKAYDLPAINLAQACYNTMYALCPSLTRAPRLPAPVLTTTCYSAMFWYSGVTLMEVSFTSWGAETSSWLNGVPSIGVFIKPAALPEEFGDSRIPEGWTVVNK